MNISQLYSHWLPLSHAPLFPSTLKQLDIDFCPLYLFCSQSCKVSCTVDGWLLMAHRP